MVFKYMCINGFASKIQMPKYNASAQWKERRDERIKFPVIKKHKNDDDNEKRPYKNTHMKTLVKSSAKKIDHARLRTRFATGI